jgi:hypothetical protein
MWNNKWNFIHICIYRNILKFSKVSEDNLQMCYQHTKVSKWNIMSGTNCFLRYWNSYAIIWHPSAVERRYHVNNTLLKIYYTVSGPGSVVGIATGYGLEGPEIEQDQMLLLTSCQETCMTYSIAVCTVENYWWWTEELSEICRVSFQK